ncbi:MAG: hypothetical protein K2P93_02700 [Alphaproteobacteria bacterium]|nr:hypothetical protein [Alphaproteobacteria bacterium]
MMIKLFFTLFTAHYLLSPLCLYAMESEKLDIPYTQVKRRPIKMPSALSFGLLGDIITFGSLLTTEGEYEVEDLPHVMALYNYFSTSPLENGRKYKFEDLKTSCTTCILSKGPFSLDRYEYLMFNLEEPTRVIENLSSGDKYQRFILIPGKRYGFGLIKRI